MRRPSPARRAGAVKTVRTTEAMKGSEKTALGTLAWSGRVGAPAGESAQLGGCEAMSLVVWLGVAAAQPRAACLNSAAAVRVKHQPFRQQGLIGHERRSWKTQLRRADRSNELGVALPTRECVREGVALHRGDRCQRDAPRHLRWFGTGQSQVKRLGAGGWAGGAGCICSWQHIFGKLACSGTQRCVVVLQPLKSSQCGCTGGRRCVAAHVADGPDGGDAGAAQLVDHHSALGACESSTGGRRHVRHAGGEMVNTTAAWNQACRSWSVGGEEGGLLGLWRLTAKRAQEAARAATKVGGLAAAKFFAAQAAERTLQQKASRNFAVCAPQFSPNFTPASSSPMPEALPPRPTASTTSSHPSITNSSPCPSDFPSSPIGGCLCTRTLSVRRGAAAAAPPPLLVAASASAPARAASGAVASPGSWRVTSTGLQSMCMWMPAARY
jgi:hypothetical protein